MYVVKDNFMKINELNTLDKIKKVFLKNKLEFELETKKNIFSLNI